MLVSNFTEEQLDRYELFRRAAFPKAAIKRVMQTIAGKGSFTLCDETMWCDVAHLTVW